MDCHYLPDRDCRPWAWLRMVMDDPDDHGAEECEPLDECNDLEAPSLGWTASSPSCEHSPITCS